MREGRQNGIALVAVLWLLLLLSIIAAGVLRDSRTAVNLSRNSVEAAKARVLADAGVERALLALSQGALEDGWRLDGVPVDWAFADSRVRIAISDEAGKVDLNRAPTPLLRRRFVAGGASDEEAVALADAVADFHDLNQLRRLNGAEDDDYRAAGYRHGAKDAPFDRVSELRRVLGMTAALFDSVAPAVTVFSGRPVVDPINAPQIVLLALPGLDGADVDAILDERERRNDRPETSPASKARRLTGIFGINVEAETPAGGRFARHAIARLSRGERAGIVIEAWGRSGRR